MNSLNTTTRAALERHDRPHSILIVDDEPRMRTSLRILLQESGREILESKSGGEAIATLKTKQIDLVLLDILLPDISGLDVLEWITSRGDALPASVIIVSVDDNIDSAIHALRNGASE